MEVLDEPRVARCIVCGGTSDDIVLRDNGYEGRACACGTIYTSPSPPPSAIDLTEVDHFREFYDLPAMFKARWVRRRSAGHSLLEIGCGEGVFLQAAQELGFQVEGVEPSPVRAEVAERRTTATVHRVLLEDFEPGPRRFDVVYHCDMLAHFADPRQALHKMTSVLSPHGVLAFEVGLLGDIPRAWYSHLGEVGYPEHLWLYSERSVRELLAQCGLRIRSATRYDLSMCIVAHETVRAAARMRRALLGSRRTRVGGGAESTGPSSAPSKSQLMYLQLQNFLRYRAGAVLPRLGPGTLLVIAERA